LSVVPISSLSSANYIEPDGRFELALAEYAQSKSQDLLTRIINQFFFVLCERVIATFKYRYPHCDSEDLVNECTHWCTRKMHLYHESRGSAFSFFTKVIQRRASDMERRAKRYVGGEISINDFNSWIERKLVA
jgi:DNA-directed RNA polymerase specialized sigma24 family protein